MDRESTPSSGIVERSRRGRIGFALTRDNGSTAMVFVAQDGFKCEDPPEHRWEVDVGGSGKKVRIIRWRYLPFTVQQLGTESVT
jgi:hypothetical protein